MEGPGGAAREDVRTKRGTRVQLVDVARGYAMFLLVFMEYAAPSVVDHPGSIGGFFARYVFVHPSWHGFAYVDLGFPAFVMMMGCSIAYRAGDEARRGSRPGSVVRRAWLRAAVLYAVGFFIVKGGFRAWPSVELVGVLQRLAVCLMVTTPIVVHVRRPTWRYVVVGLLVGYWVPFLVSGSAAPYEPRANVAAALDVAVLGAPRSEGLLGTVPAVATCLLGAMMSGWVAPSGAIRWARRRWVASGLALIAGGVLWSHWLPINKHLWTSSFVLVTAGLTFVTYAVLSAVVELWPKSRLLVLWEIFGAHSLFTYIALEIFDFRDFASRLVGGPNVGWWGHRALMIEAGAFASVCTVVVAWHASTGARRRSHGLPPEPVRDRVVTPEAQLGERA